MEKFKDLYNKKVAPNMVKHFNYKSNMEVPRIVKVVLNMGVGEAVTVNAKFVDSAANELTNIAGQKAVITKAKTSISSFKLREGMPIGCKVTLRKDRMFEFLERLVIVALPRVRDFRGISKKSFDGRGNISFGIKEQIVFPEINYDKIDAVRGLDITIVTTAKTDEEASYLLKNMFLPII